MNLIEELETIFINERNNIRLLDTYNYVIILLSDIDRKAELIYIQKLMTY